MTIPLRLITLCFWLAIALVTSSCGTDIGVGVAIAYPTPWKGPWGDAVYVGGPVYR